MGLFDFLKKYKGERKDARTEKDYISAMRKMILRVQNATDLDEIDTFTMTANEAEILFDCMKEGYLIGKVPKDETDFRTMDGKAHPELINTVVPPKGLAFLRPVKTDLKSNIALGVSVFAALISLFAFLVTLLANLDKIIQNWSIFVSLLGS